MSNRRQKLEARSRATGRAALDASCCDPKAQTTTKAPGWLRFAAMDDRFQRMVARIGADDYLDMCARSLHRQDGRLRQTRVSPGTERESWEFGREIMPDIWLTLIALSGSLRALKLAVKVPQTRSQAIDTLRQDLTHRSSIVDARNVYEHLDDYFQGAGHLQPRIEASHSALPARPTLAAWNSPAARRRAPSPRSAVTGSRARKPGTTTKP